MAFGSWTGNEGMRSDDPWNQTDTAAGRVSQCRHEPELVLLGLRHIWEINPMKRR